MGADEPFAGIARRPSYELAGTRDSDTLLAMSTLSEIEAAIEKLSPVDTKALVAWLAARVSPEETPYMLAAIDEADRSLREEGGVPVEEVRRDIRRWTIG